MGVWRRDHVRCSVVFSNVAESRSFARIHSAAQSNARPKEINSPANFTGSIVAQSSRRTNTQTSIITAAISSQSEITVAVFTIAPPLWFRYVPGMSDATPEPHPFVRLQEAMKKVLSVPKAEILRREKEAKETRKRARKNGKDVSA